MLVALLVILIILWFLGYVRVGGITIPDISLFVLNGQEITLWNILILLVLSGVVGILPRPFREIAGVLVVLWVLSVLGILAFTGLSNLLVLAVIIGLIVFLIGGFA